jgi:hypothetical protein
MREHVLDMSYDEEVQAQMQTKEGVTRAWLSLWIGRQESIGLPMDGSTSLWRWYIFPELKDELGESKAVIVYKFHHSLADGFAMARVLITMMTPPTRAPPPAMAAAAAKRSAARKANLTGNLTAKATSSGGHSSLATIDKVIVKFCQAFAKLLLLPDDPVSVLKPATRQTGDDPKSVTFSIPGGRERDPDCTIPALKRAARAFELTAETCGGHHAGVRITVNDVIAAALSACLLRWAREKEEINGEKRLLHVISCKPPAEDLGMGKGKGLVSAKLPEKGAVRDLCV